MKLIKLRHDYRPNFLKIDNIKSIRIHYCLFDKDCRMFGAPWRIYLYWYGHSYWIDFLPALRDKQTAKMYNLGDFVTTSKDD
jgi:hypothetical protein